jgi:hypothetical protein
LDLASLNARISGEVESKLENLYLKNLVNAGVFYARKKIFTELNHGKGVIDLVKNLLPIFLKNEFDMYFFGKTLVSMNNNTFAYPHDIKNWIDSLFSKTIFS